jgi:hypothetical protein
MRQDRDSSRSVLFLVLFSVLFVFVDLEDIVNGGLSGVNGDE